MYFLTPNKHNCVFCVAPFVFFHIWLSMCNVWGKQEALSQWVNGLLMQPLEERIIDPRHLKKDFCRYLAMHNTIGNEWWQIRMKTYAAGIMPWVMTTCTSLQKYALLNWFLTAMIQRRYQTEVFIIEQTLRAWVTVDHHALSLLRPHLDLLHSLILRYLRPKFSHLQFIKDYFMPSTWFPIAMGQNQKETVSASSTFILG